MKKRFTNLRKRRERDEKVRHRERRRVENLFQDRFEQQSKETSKTIRDIHKQWKQSLKRLEDKLNREADIRVAKAVKEKENEIEVLRDAIRERDKKLKEADKQLKLSQNSYLEWREFAEGTLRIAQSVYVEIAGILNLSGEFYKRLSTLRDRMETMDRRLNNMEPAHCRMLDLDPAAVRPTESSMNDMKNLRDSLIIEKINN